MIKRLKKTQLVVGLTAVVLLPSCAKQMGIIAASTENALQAIVNNGSTHQAKNLFTNIPLPDDPENPLALKSVAGEITPCNGRIYFRGKAGSSPHRLWRFDPSNESFELLVSGHRVSDLICADGVLLYTARLDDTSESNNRLAWYASDTETVFDDESDPLGPSDYRVVSDTDGSTKLYFFAQNSEATKLLWRSDSASDWQPQKLHDGPEGASIVDDAEFQIIFDGQGREQVYYSAAPDGEAVDRVIYRISSGIDSIFVEPSEPMFYFKTLNFISVSSSSFAYRLISSDGETDNNEAFLVEAGEAPAAYDHDSPVMHLVGSYENSEYLLEKTGIQSRMLVRYSGDHPGSLSGVILSYVASSQTRLLAIGDQHLFIAMHNSHQYSKMFLLDHDSLDSTLLNANFDVNSEPTAFNNSVFYRDATDSKLKVVVGETVSVPAGAENIILPGGFAVHEDRLYFKARGTGLSNEMYYLEIN